MRPIIAFGSAVILGLCMVASATVLHVPGEYPTIQAGIDAAVDGDTVLVADGTYTGEGNRDIDFGGRAILLTSENGRDATVIDCEGSEVDPHRGFIFHSGEGPGSIVEGFTITNGWVPYGGGGAIQCYGYSSPTIIDNLITGNRIPSAEGGGIVCYQQSCPVIRGNTISDNLADLGDGAGIHCRASSPIIEGNTITGNWAAFGCGGGISCAFGSSPTIVGNVITGNTASISGGGVWCDSSSPLIRGNTIVENRVSFGGGGGITCHYSSAPLIEDNTIAGNLAADGSGGGIACASSFPVVSGNTIVGNRAVDRGGGFSCGAASSAIIMNSILWADSASSDPEIYVDEAATLVVAYSDVRGGWPGGGNIDGWPKFVLPAADDYRLLWGSPCIDAGHPDSLDPDGTRCDMGAHYFDQLKELVTYVTPESRTLCRGDACRILYTLVNCHLDPVSVRGIVELTLPDGEPWPGNPLEGPGFGVMHPEYTWRYVREYTVPETWPLGTSRFTWKVGFPGSLYDKDGFTFAVVEP